MNRIAELLGNDSGATTIEYAAIASLISIVGVGVISTIGTSVVALFATIPTF